MSNEPLEPTPVSSPLPAAQGPSAPPPSRGNTSAFGCFLGISVALNILLGLVLLVTCLGVGVLFSGRGGNTSSGIPVIEEHYSGKKTANDKVAIVSLEGALMDGLLGQVEKEIEKAADDKTVKAVVFRVNSPGGSITASDNILRRLRKLRDGDEEKGRTGKPLIVSMGSVAASGGYYVSMPGQYIFAEPTTITGSIGVYASFPNLSEFPKKYGIDFKTIKAGELKNIGAMFRTMKPKEEQVMQDMVDDAYLRFLDVIEKGRKDLTRKKMLERFEVKPINPDPKAFDEKRPAPKPYTRYRADGAIFTARMALDKGLIDEIGSLEDAIVKAGKQAELSDYRAVKYKKLPFLADLLLNSKAPEPSKLSAESLRPLLMPRLWYLAPGYEAAVRVGEVGR